MVSGANTGTQRVCAVHPGGYGVGVASVGRPELREWRPATAAGVGTLRRRVVAVAARGGATTRQLEEVAVAVSEALTNVVRHAYGGQASAGRMFLRAAIVDGVLEAVVGDEGAGLPAPEDMPRTGLGLVIIARLTERLEFRDAAPGVELHMSFPLG